MKKINKKDAKLVKREPKSIASPGVCCRTTSGQEYLIISGPKQDLHTLWKKTDEGYLELAIAESPYELYDIIDWSN